MRKPLPIQLSIPSPCSQSWDEMTPDAHGRFCAHCQKSVIDFTGWSDKMLYDFFSKNNGATCGRFRIDQLHRTINISPQPHSKLYRIAIALGLTILVAQAYEVRARVMPPLKEQNILVPVNDSTGADTVIFKGQVLDEKKESMIGVVVQLENAGILVGGAPTDIDGFFEIRISPDHLKNLPDSLQIRFFYSGYKTQLIRISKNQPELSTPFLMQLSTDRITTGIIMMGGISFWPPLIRQEHPGPNKTFTTKDLHNMGY